MCHPPTCKAKHKKQWADGSDQAHLIKLCRCSWPERWIFFFVAFFGWKVYIIYDKARYIIGISHAWTHASNPSSWKIPVACPLTRRQTIKERSNDSQGKKERQCAFFFRKQNGLEDAGSHVVLSVFACFRFRLIFGIWWNSLPQHLWRGVWGRTHADRAYIKVQ